MNNLSVIIIGSGRHAKVLIDALQMCHRDILGENSIINSRASIDHDCCIGNHVHMAPGVTLSENVEVEDLTHIGTGVVVIQGIQIGRKSIIGAGVTITKNVPDNSKISETHT